MTTIRIFLKNGGSQDSLNDVPICSVWFTLIEIVYIIFVMLSDRLFTSQIGK